MWSGLAQLMKEVVVAASDGWLERPVGEPDIAQTTACSGRRSWIFRRTPWLGDMGHRPADSAHNGLHGGRALPV